LSEPTSHPPTPQDPTAHDSASHDGPGALPDGHLALDALADVAAGQRPADGHVTGCADCAAALADVTASQQQVAALLSALPAPVLPADVAARLEGALQAAAAQPRGRAPLSVVPSPAEPPRTPLRAPPRRAWVPAAAAAAVLVTGAGLGYGALSGGAGGDESTSGGTVAALDVAALPTSSTGTDYADPAATVAVLPVVLSGELGSPEGESLPGAEDRSGPDDSAAAAQAPVQESGPEQAPVQESGPGQGPPSGQGPAAAPDGERTAEQEPDLGPGTEEGPLGHLRRDALVPPGDPAASPPLGRLRDPQQLEQCLSALRPAERPGSVPLAVDYARYDGRPALAVLLPAPAPDQVDLYVVGEGCGPGDDRLLASRRLDRP
jgi:hypothetical protein